ncbi:hypothetical protein GTY65_34010 [Streptomyces sp. SID8379]|uniref:hypothetical protein n=1 Tax=unclassified Streptomyces TaxID=2593676 RepID=UPI000360EF8B|nr:MULTISPECIES: hypothetical protein [unclassified Streptomyces]MYW69052.1 hypothetical protein [Streptomyces sp. SID8379]
MYHYCVVAAVDAPETAQKLGIRLGATRRDVIEQMLTPRCQRAVYNRARGVAWMAYDRATASLQSSRARQQAAAGRTSWNWRLVCGIFLAAACVVFFTGGLGALAVAVGGFAITVFALSGTGTLVGWNLGHCLLAGIRQLVCLTDRCELGIRAAGWGETLSREGVGPVLEEMIRHLLGDDPDSLFIPHGTSYGLRAPRNPDYFVSTETVEQLQRKLNQIDEGTIALCGPRGVGKTTLLERCTAAANFGVLVQAPAAYAPADFLLSLSVRLCESYIRHEGCTAPEFTRISPFHRMLRRARTRMRLLGRWSVFALPAAALFVLGLSASARSLYGTYIDSLGEHARSAVGDLERWGQSVWDGHQVVASLTLCIVAVFWWRSRHDPWILKLLRRLWSVGSGPLGFLISLASVATVLGDPEMMAGLTRLPPGVYLPAIALLSCWMYTLSKTHSEWTTEIGGWTIRAERLAQVASLAVGTYLLYFLISTPPTYALLADPDNPLRLAGVIAGELLTLASLWRPRPSEPALVTRCRNHLYRLQTTQTSTNTLSPSAAQILTLGGSHATSISTTPPNYPELVDEFRDLLAHIAHELVGRGQNVLIAIDEVDRLGTDTEALAFLREIKGILGVRHVHYLISVAEDVGASFVRRGLPHRDVTDSSLDDIVHVTPCTLAEAGAILTERSEHHTAHFAFLAHAVSGGLLRDLLRYSLRIEEIQDKTGSHELMDISTRLILEELGETLAGFRTLLSKHQWSENSSGILSSFRTLCGHLRTPCACTRVQVLQSLQQFAFYAGAPHAEAVRDITDEARQLIEEAAAYSYFSLTLIDIFGMPSFDQRSTRALDHGPDGAPERLAEARLELGVSPYSARSLIDDIRKAWSLATGPSLNTPFAHRTVNCPVHGNRYIPVSRTSD